MPPKPRTPEQKQQDKQKIIDAALAIVQKSGLDGLTIRKLSAKLKMSSTNIYNYFYNKDEIYLHILISGFQLLQSEQAAKLEDMTDPLQRLEHFLRCWAGFGMRHPAYYQLMFSTQDPKSMDYTDTPIEELARYEKAVAMRSFDQLQELISACAPDLTGETLRTTSIRIACEVHGGINFYHSNIIREMYGDPMEILEDIMQHILAPFQRT